MMTQIKRLWAAQLHRHLTYDPNDTWSSGSGFHKAGDLFDDVSSPTPPASSHIPAAEPEACPGSSFFTSAGDLDSFSLEGKRNVVIGRKNDCDLVANRSHIGSEHARITVEDGAYYLTDLGTDAGTYLNDERISGTVRLRPEDRISMADVNMLFTGDNVLYDKKRSEGEVAFDSSRTVGSRPVVLKANIRSKKVKDHSGSGMKELIRDINLELREGTLVALLGTAGAGKSTVMNCLNGMDLQGVDGSVFYRGVDLMRDFERMKYMIGSVPQKKVFHAAFTPEEEFRQSAILRLPADTTSKEIKRRVDQTLEMLSMTGVRKSRNSTLSGGEQTRVNVGIELVADRDLLCLDEPDQGLSPNYKHELFQIMQNLAHNYGKTVLSIIHDVSEIDMFDQVIILAKTRGVGRLAFSGTPAEAREFFGVDIRDAYALLERDPEKFVKC